MQGKNETDVNSFTYGFNLPSSNRSINYLRGQENGLDAGELSTTLSQQLSMDSEPTNANQKNKLSRAARRREKRANERRAQEQALNQAAISASKSCRTKELNSLEELLKSRKLRIHDVPSDGDCLYSSIAHQLSLRNYDIVHLIDSRSADLASSGNTVTARILRLIAAQYLRMHADEFMPFMFVSETGEPMTSDEYSEYCLSVEKSSTWGGQIEIRALSNALRIPIEVLQAEAPSIIIGEEFRDQKPVTLIYHRHAFALGEHYNSCVPVSEPS